MHGARRELCLRAHAAQRSASRRAHTGQARMTQTLTLLLLADTLRRECLVPKFPCTSLLSRQYSTTMDETMRNRFENAHAADEAERSTHTPQHSTSVHSNETLAAGRFPVAPKRSHVPYVSPRLKRDKPQLQRVRAHMSEKERQRGYLPFLCSESELNSVQQQFDRWKNAILKLNTGHKSALRYSNDRGRWLYEHHDVTSMRDAWEALSIEKRRKEWPAVMLATLTNCPSKVAMVLEATLNPLPPGYAIHDVLHVMGQRLQLDSIKDANDRALMADKVLALLAHMLEDVPEGHVPFRQHTVGLFAARLPAAQAKDLYDMLKKKDFRLHRHTELQFASKLASEVAYKNTAYEILKAMVENGAALNDAASASVVTKLLQFKTMSDYQSQGVDSFAAKDALELFMAHGYTPNTITLTALLSTLCQAGQTEEAIHLALLFAEHGVQLDGRAWTTVFAGAKASLNVETVTKALLVAKVTPVSFASVLSNALHAVFYFATSETHSKKMKTPWSVPMFRPMLKTYAKKFELKSLQWWLPDSLPLLLSDEGIDKEVDDKFRDPLDREWDFVHTILPVVDKVFETEGDAAETKLQPNTMADAVMLRAYIRSLSHPQDILAFYRYFKSRLEEDEKYPKLLLQSQGAMIHDTFILVMTEHRELWREALHVFGDMLKATLRTRSAANNDNVSNQAPDSTSHLIHPDHGKLADETAMEVAVHPAPTVLTMTILLRGLLYQGEDALAEQLLQVMRELDIEPNLVTWNTLIRHKALAQNTKETVTLLQEMEATGLKPDKYTYDAFRKLRDQDKALKMMQLIVDENRESIDAE
ncbi:Pentatricopeptide repeat-containing protein, mitochondrial [Beauveria bassiana]|nr:Pentatricopeptide repeat-containing protein, mitochondrial [Beauveria bassiana]KAF1732882.1 Pentatricopeptide repeat-containing protein, mitochondrial [Beauveria bassiana]KAF1732883.1 Pentatricopeptide repeat-containing protein, mitochondrial [Beauveria bassiana]KAH8713077.1 Pentatricopeptide repeat-containing protein, mitochondrial [Beauveria bassiana]